MDVQDLRLESANTVGVFGANGFIGRHLVRRLGALGVPTIAFGRSFPPNYPEIVGFDVERRWIDFVDVLGTHAKIPDIDIVVQLINSSGPALANKRAVADVQENVVPQIGFIESCIMSRVKRYIFISSGGTIYGDPKILPISEEHPTMPLNSYGMTKLFVEQYLRILTSRSDMKFTSLRVSNPFGPGQDNQRGQGIVPAVIKNLERGQPLMIYGNGSSLRDYIYIDDVISAIILSMKAPAANGPLNIGTSIGRSILDVVREMEKALGSEVPVQFVDSRPTDAKSNVLDCTKARRLLDWEPRVNFSDGLRRTVEDIKLHPRPMR